jgi:hypothetical protein
MLSLLLPLVTSILPDVLKRILPEEKMSEANRLQLEAEMTREFLARDWSVVEAEFKDRADARVLAAQDVAGGNAWTKSLAALVRPAWGFATLALYGMAWYTGKPIPVALDGATSLVIMFYFGGRTLEKLAPTVAIGWGKK